VTIPDKEEPPKPLYVQAREYAQAKLAEEIKQFEAVGSHMRQGTYDYLMQRYYREFLDAQTPLG